MYFNTPVIRTAYISNHFLLSGGEGFLPDSDREEMDGLDIKFMLFDFDNEEKIKMLSSGNKDS
jgi:hypothetical protein